MNFSIIKSIILPVGLCLVSFWLMGQSGDWHDAGRSNGMSMNWYQMPYQLNTDQWVLVHSNNVRHQNGHNGLDINSFPDTYDDSNDTCDIADSDAGLMVTAAAAGTVRRVVDTNCCRNTSSNCNPAATYTINCIWIEHDNDEWSAYYHIAQNTAVVSEGQVVTAGTPLGLEGEVGPASGVHLHFALYYNWDGVTPKNMVSPSAFLGQRIPLVCGKIQDHFFVQRDKFVDDSNYDPAQHEKFFDENDGVIGGCALIQPEDANLSISGLNINDVQVEKAVNTISVSFTDINPPNFGGACSGNSDCPGTGVFCARVSNSSATCRNNGGSVVYSAGDRVTLGRGFRAKAGSYFRAEIGNYFTPQFGPGNGSGAKSNNSDDRRKQRKAAKAKYQEKHNSCEGHSHG